MAFSSRDWGATRGDAWLYGIVVGWDNDPDDDPEDHNDAMAELAVQYGWGADDVTRLRDLHAAWVALAESAG